MNMTAEQLAQTIRPDLEMLCSSEELTSERRDALARIVEHLTPPNLLALLDELERKDKQAERLDFTYMNALELPDDASRNDILAGIHALRYSLNAANKRIAEREAISSAAEKLVRCKGRYHSEQNYRTLAALFGVTTPDLPPLESEARTVTVKLPRYDLDQSDCDSCGQDCGADMSEEPDGDYVLLSDVLERLAAAGINLTVEG